MLKVTNILYYTPLKIKRELGRPTILMSEEIFKFLVR